jgi:hypothetical protein
MPFAHLRTLSLVVASALAVLAAAMAARLPWATAAWPWPDGRLTHLFVASILASMAIAVFWIGWTARWRAAVPGTVNVFVTATAFAVYLGVLYTPPAQAGAAPAAFPAHVAVLAALAAGNAGLFFVFRGAPPLAGRPMPPLVRVSFVLFAAVLLAVGAALVAGVPNVMPWPMQPRSAVLVGWIFLGDALYFLLPLRTPLWDNARAPLLSFLAYDLVLLPPLAAHLATVRPEHVASLVVYLAVLAYSAALAIYYLFLHPATRAGLWRRQGAA